MKTKEQIAKYNKEYFARPDVIARAKVRNAKYRERRKLHKKTVAGRAAENRYRRKRWSSPEIQSRNLFLRYGITLDTYNEMSKKQNDCCAICLLNSDKRLHVDHCHVTGRVRGLLCGSCNRSLGLLKDRVDFLTRAIEYLTK